MQIRKQWRDNNFNSIYIMKLYISIIAKSCTTAQLGLNSLIVIVVTVVQALHKSCTTALHF